MKKIITSKQQLTNRLDFLACRARRQKSLRRRLFRYSDRCINYGRIGRIRMVCPVNPRFVKNFFYLNYTKGRDINFYKLLTDS